MISEKMSKALNEQINKEMYSGYLYMSMSSFFSDKGLDGFATWFMVQYHEEMFHAMKIYQYLFDQGSKAVLASIDKPEESWDSPMAVLEETLAHEKKVTASIHNLVKLADSESDYATSTFLKWYVTEQVEEEKNANDMITRLEWAGGGKGPGLFMVDKELSARSVGVATDFTGPLSESD
jgi:ferritin